MTVAAMRERLMAYLTNADDKKVKALYILLEGDIPDDPAYTFTDDQMKVLNERRATYLAGKDKSTTDWEHMHETIRNKRKFSTTTA